MTGRRTINNSTSNNNRQPHPTNRGANAKLHIWRVARKCHVWLGDSWAWLQVVRSEWWESQRRSPRETNGGAPEQVQHLSCHPFTYGNSHKRSTKFKTFAIFPAIFLPFSTLHFKCLDLPTYTHRQHFPSFSSSALTHKNLILSQAFSTWRRYLWEDNYLLNSPASSTWKRYLWEDNYLLNSPASSIGRL